MTALLRSAGLTPVRIDPRRRSASATRSRPSRRPGGAGSGTPPDPQGGRRRWRATARRAGRHRDRRRRSGRGGPGRPARGCRAARSSSSSGRRPGAGGPAACSPRRPRSRRCGAPASDAATLAAVARPIPAMRVETPSRDDVPPDLRHRDRRRARRRVRSVAARPGAPRSGDRRRRRRPARLARDRRRPATPASSRSARPDGRPATLRAAVVVGADGLHSVVARGGRRRPAGPPRPAGRADLPPPRSRPGRVPRRPDARPARRLHRDRAGGRRPGQRRDRAGPVVASGAPPDGRAGGRRLDRGRRSRRPTTTRPPGATARRPTPSPAPGRSAIA